jgi:hypothetical protein
MSAMDTLKAATAALAGTNLKIENETLGVIYVKPALSCGTANEIQNVKASEGTIKGICLEVVYRAVDENGAALFKKTDVITMMAEIDSEAITGIYMDMKAAIFAGKSTPATSSTTG